MEIAKISVSGTEATLMSYREIPAGIIGATISFDWVDSLWNGLTKTVEFKGCCTKDVLDVGASVAIPAEVVAKPSVRVYVGVYGVDAEGNIAIPTFWTSLGVTRAAVAPSGDTSTDAGLPVWSQILAMIGNLAGLNTEAQNNLVAAINEALTKGSDIDEAEIQRIVSDCLTKYPPEPGESGGYYIPEVTQTDANTMHVSFAPSGKDMPAVEPESVTLPQGPRGEKGENAVIDATLTQSGQAADAAVVGEKFIEFAKVVSNKNAAVFVVQATEPEDTSVLWVDPSDETGTTLGFSIGTVETLDAGSNAEATITGTPENPILNLGIPKGADGYTPLKGVDYSTEAEIQKIAEQAASLVDVPESVTMQPLTFTGAVSATYDGSTAMTVEIPSGGGGNGGGETWEELMNVTTEEEVTHIIKTLENPGKFKMIACGISTVGVSGNSVVGAYLAINDIGQWIANTGTNLWYNPKLELSTNLTIQSISRLTPVFARTELNPTNEGNTGHEWRPSITSETEITTLHIGTQNWSARFGVGSVFKVYGVRA